MRRMRFFASRNAREILRDPISVGFGVVFPILLLLLLSFLNRHIPAEAHMTLFEPEQLAPGVSVFSLSFLALFSALLLSRDRSSALILRLYASPLTGRDFILGYLLPMLPMALAQTLVCLLAAIPLGLPVSWRILACTAVNVPIALVNLALGMLCGTLLPEKAVGGMCGALLTNVSAWLSGIWFSLDLGGKVFRRIAYALPFANAVDAAQAALAGDWGGMFPQLWIVLAWAFGLLTAKKMGAPAHVRIETSGCDHIVTVDTDLAAGTSRAEMPLPQWLRSVQFGEHQGTLVHLGGIAHLVLENVEPSQAIFDQAEPLFRDIPGLDAYGVIFLDTNTLHMTPLVKVPATNTLVWEGSCGSGSLASALAQSRDLTDGTFSRSYIQPAGTVTATAVREGGKVVKTYIGGPVTLGEPFETEVKG